MKSKSTSKNEHLSDETRNELKELFDELFVKGLSENIVEVKEEANSLSKTIGNSDKDINNQLLCLDDTLKEILETIACMGNKNDWGQNTLVDTLNTHVDALNRLIGVINDVKKEISIIQGNDEKIINILNLTDEKSKFKEMFDSIIDLKNYSDKSENSLHEINNSISAISSDLDIIKKNYSDLQDKMFATIEEKHELLEEKYVFLREKNKHLSIGLCITIVLNLVILLFVAVNFIKI